MPSYLGFDSTGMLPDGRGTKEFRNFLISKTLNAPNGPQTFTSSSYTYRNLSDMPDKDPGDVEKSDDFNLVNEIARIRGSNNPSMSNQPDNELFSPTIINEKSNFDPGDVEKSKDFNLVNEITKIRGLNNPPAPNQPDNELFSPVIINDRANFDPGDVEKNNDFNLTNEITKIRGYNNEPMVDKPHGELFLPTEINDRINNDPGDVEKSDTFLRDTELKSIQTSNVYKPDKYFINESLDTIPRKANLKLYPDSFVRGQNHNLVGIMSTSNYDTESELFKFAASYIKNDINGPVLSRFSQNLYTATAGRARILDALDGNTSTALNLLTGKENLIEYNNKVTVNKTIIGKGIGFLETVSGVQNPLSEIPGDYLTNPQNPTTFRRETGELGKTIQDIVGNIGGILGIQRNPKPERKPSDLFIEHTGEGTRRSLYNNLSYNLKYRPDYTTTARSQNSSKLFNFVDTMSEAAKTVLGLEAPEGSAYIGDDRSNDLRLAMGDPNYLDGRIVKSGFYLAVMFDPNLRDLMQGERNISEGGSIAGKLTWISAKSKNKLGANNAEFQSESSQYGETLSTGITFRDDSILGQTQDLLNTLPEGGEARSHVANVIDQTSRIFKEGDEMLSRGSAIKYVNQFTGEESGVEYCRVWTKDRSYMNYSDTMKRQGNVRNFESSVLGGVSRPWNINIGPMSNGNKAFDGSSNIVKNSGGDFYAKKYMFSIENLAWKTSTVPGFTWKDLPYCERGPNGGRVMWFPPYDLKVNEQNSAKWEENMFIGRPEPVYTYQNATRNGNISFKVIVDHPSVLNLLVREHFKGMSDEESDNYINAFFAGCEEIDFYDLIRRYSTLDGDDIKNITNYLNAGKDSGTTLVYKTKFEPVKGDNTPEQPDGSGQSGGQIVNTSYKNTLYFNNDIPGPNDTGIVSAKSYDTLYDEYIAASGTTYLSDLNTGLDILFNATTWGSSQKNDEFNLFGQTGSTSIHSITELKNKVRDEIASGFTILKDQYSGFSSDTEKLKQKLIKGEVKDVTLTLQSTCSAVADNKYNLNLSFRRSHAILTDFVNKIKNIDKKIEVRWKDIDFSSSNDSIVLNDVIELPFSELGYDKSAGKLYVKYVKNLGESPKENVTTTQFNTKGIDCHNKNFLTSDNLKRTAPLAFWCRESTITVDYSTQIPSTVSTTPTQVPGVTPTSIIMIETDRVSKKQKPPLDELKKIVTKTLGECYYFKQLEEKSPIIFGSLKEKLRYFHPSFHSMTPEGLNSRLTFLQQCLRPGDTIPIKGINDESDLNARNTTFGPPPVCVLRIGDFFHSKIIIRDINISYDDSTWDLNPEGIGVQPMIANVTLSVSFIGGQGLEKPVEKLQNALSSNFYANTEMYDYRSTPTEDRTKFTKEFLEDLLKTAQKVPDPINDPKSPNVITNGQYIGSAVFKASNVYPPVSTPDDQIEKLGYDSIIDDVFNCTKSYLSLYENVLRINNDKYGPKINSLLFSPKYRTITGYTVQTDIGSETIELLGEYPYKNDLNSLCTYFKNFMIDKIDDPLTVIGNYMEYDEVLSEPIIQRSEIFLKPYVKNKVISIIDEIFGNKAIKGVEIERNKLISALDKLNFIIGTNGIDGKIIENDYVGATLSGFTKSILYNKYKSCIAFIKNKQSALSSGIDPNFIFVKNMTIDDEIFVEILKSVLKDKQYDLLKIYDADKVIFNKSVMKKITKKVLKFVPTSTKLTATKSILTPFPIKGDNKPSEFGIIDELGTFTDQQKENLTKVLSTRVKLGSTLNYYKP